MSINQENDVKKRAERGGRVARPMRNKIKYIFNLRENFPPSQRVAKITHKKIELNFQKKKKQVSKICEHKPKKKHAHTHTPQTNHLT
jgi:hypothetical protein